MPRQLSGLWRNPDFMKLWIGQTISEFGSRITRDGLPLTAILILHASPTELSLLVAASSLPVLFFGLFVGAWVDRLRRRPLMIGADLLRMILLLTIPLAAFTGNLTITLLYVVAAMAGLLGVLFDVAYRAILPTLIEDHQLVEGNSKLATTDSLAEVVGPTVAGALIQVMTAPLAIFFDAISFLFSAISALMIRKPEPQPEHHTTAGGRAILREIADGLKFIAGEPTLRTIALGMGIRSFFGNFYAVLYSLYAVRDLGLMPGALGIVIACGGIGSLIGALIAGRAALRMGVGRVMVTALMIGAAVNFLIPMAGGPAWLAATFLIVGQIVNDAAMTVFLIHEMSLRQTITPSRLLGRINASLGFLAEGVGPFGALVGGALASLTDARFTLLVAALGIMGVAIMMARSRLRVFTITESASPTVEASAGAVK